MARPGIEGRFSPVLAANHVGNGLGMSAGNQTFEPQDDTMVVVCRIRSAAVSLQSAHEFSWLPERAANFLCPFNSRFLMLHNTICVQADNLAHCPGLMALNDTILHFEWLFSNTLVWQGCWGDMGSKS